MTAPQTTPLELAAARGVTAAGPALGTGPAAHQTHPGPPAPRPGVHQATGPAGFPGKGSAGPVLQTEAGGAPEPPASPAEPDWVCSVCNRPPNPPRRIITCTACGEEKPHHARRWCNACYQRWKYAGRPGDGPPPPGPRGRREDYAWLRAASRRPPGGSA